MLMTALYVLAGGFIAIAALGHLLVFNALMFGKTEPSAKSSASTLNRTAKAA
jgi:hypothetical protein